MEIPGVAELEAAGEPVPEEIKPAAALRLCPASAETAARLLGGETPYLLGRYENDAITALALSDGEELLLCTAGDPAFEGVCAALYGAKGLITRDSKLLYRHCMTGGHPLPQVKLDCELAAYLLRPTASDYTTDRLAAEYAVVPLPCESEDPLAQEMAKLIPLAAALEAKIAQQAQQWLLTEVEQPLAEVLASMELIGFALDTEGLTAYGQEPVSYTHLDVYKRQVRQCWPPWGWAAAVS